MCSHQHTRAKSFQILLSLWRTEKHLILRKDVLKSRVAATVLIVGGGGDVCDSRANHAGPSRCTQSLCCLVGSGSGGVREALYNLLLPHPSKWVFWWETPFVQDGHARIRRKKLKSMSYKDICCWYIPKTSQVTAWPSFCAPHASCFLCISR